MNGTIEDVAPLIDGEVAVAIRKRDKKARKAQRRTGRAQPRHRAHVKQMLQIAARRTVAMAVKHRARITMEDLDGFKALINARRPKGAHKNGWRVLMDGMPLGEFERQIAMRTKMAGLPPLAFVAARGTSTTCPSCGRRDKQNRPAPRAPFSCIAYGFAADSDDVGAVNIARHGLMSA